MTAPNCRTPAGAVDSQARAEREAMDAATALLRKAGCRPTAQRLPVLQALGGGDHVSADAILAHARERHPAMHPSTVYRTVEAPAAATGFTPTNDRELTIPGRCPGCTEGADDAHP